MPATERRSRTAAVLLAVAVGALLVAGLGGLFRQSEPRRAPEARPPAPEAPEPVRAAAARPRPTVAAPAAPRPSGPVECQLTDEVPLWGTEIEELDPETLEPLAVHVPRVDGDWIRFTPRNADGLGRIRTPRHAPATLAWIAGACIDLVLLEALPARAVSGVVHGQIEVGGVAVHAQCEGSERGGFSGSLPPDGRFALEAPADLDCALVVRRVFGARSLESDPVPLARGAAPLEGLELHSPLPPGVGLGLARLPGGLVVHDLQRDSAATRAGIRLRDLVVAVDGEPAEGLDPQEVMAFEGPLTLEIARGSEVFDVEVAAEAEAAPGER